MNSGEIRAVISSSCVMAPPQRLTPAPKGKPSDSPSEPLIFMLGRSAARKFTARAYALAAALVGTPAGACVRVAEMSPAGRLAAPQPPSSTPIDKNAKIPIIRNMTVDDTNDAVIGVSERVDADGSVPARATLTTSRSLSLGRDLLEIGFGKAKQKFDHAPTDIPAFKPSARCNLFDGFLPWHLELQLSFIGFAFRARKGRMGVEVFLQRVDAGYLGFVGIHARPRRPAVLSYQPVDHADVEHRTGRK